MATVDHRAAFINRWLDVYNRGYFASNKIEVILGDIYDELVFTRQDKAPEPGWKPWCGDSKPPYPDSLYTVLRRDGTQRTGAPDEVGSWKHTDDEAGDEIVAYSVSSFIEREQDWQLSADQVFTLHNGAPRTVIKVERANGLSSTGARSVLATHLFKLLSGKTAPNHGWKPALSCLPTKDDEDPFGHVVIKRNEQAKPKFIRACFVRRELADHPTLQWCPSGLSLPREKD